MHLTRLLANALMPAGLFLACAAAAPTTAPSGTAPLAGGTGYAGLTEPHKHVKLISKGGTIKQVLKERGDRVKQGELLLKFREEEEEQAKLDMYKIEANSDTPIKMAEAKRDNAVVELKRLEQMAAKKVANEYELNKARLEVRLAELEIKRAEEEHAQKKVQVTYQEAVLNNLRMTSTVDGIVEEIACREGETITPQSQEGAIRIVQIDPLDVKVSLPMTIAQRIKVGQKLMVTVPGESQPRSAEVYYRAPVMDSAANEQIVRLRLPNPEGRDAGMWVQVMVPEVPAAGLAANKD